jgi:DNA-binding NarL/FixJ family response regulator
LIGRRDEIASLERLLDRLDRGRGSAVALVGEPGIGKTRLLTELRTRSVARGHLVLLGVASEFERDIPFGVFIDALDDHLGRLDLDRFGLLGDPIKRELGQIFPSLRTSAQTRGAGARRERHRSHAAVRILLGRLARDRPLVVILDDVQWADPASTELLDALLRRSADRVVLVLALRPIPRSRRLPAALARAERAGALVRHELGTLTPSEAGQLVGEDVAPAVVRLLYQETDGNPFYLEQLARSLDRSALVSANRSEPLADIGIPPAVAAALAEELHQLSELARRVFDGAAVAGDPFDLEIAAAAAATTEKQTIEAIDEIFRFDLVRPTAAPRRFRFRHALIRRAAYESAPAAWRVGAHERCAEALRRRGASAAIRAHHVERSAAYGDLGAVALLKEAGETAVRLAPESAARWFDAALSLLPADASVDERVALLLARAAALASAGHIMAGHQVLLEATRILPDSSTALAATVATACAREERLIGRYERAHVRLTSAIRRHRGPASKESVALLIELTLNDFYRSKFADMAVWAEHAAAAASEVADPVLLAAALAMPALADAVGGRPDRARARRDAAATLLDGLPDEELARRIDAATWLSATELYLDMYAEADVHASRALDVSHAAACGDPAGLYQILPRVWYVRGKLADAAEMLDDAIEGGRLLGTPPGLAGNLFNRSAIALAAGDLPLAEAMAEEAGRLANRLGEGFVAAWAAVRLAAVRLEMGDPARAAALLVERAGGEELTLIPGGWGVYCLELLTQSLLASGRMPDAAKTARLAEARAETLGLPLARVWSQRAVAAVALQAGAAVRAADQALASADGAEAVGAPLEAAHSRALAGQALASSGEVERGVSELRRAVEAFDSAGALRYRERAEQQLGQLGQRPYRRSRRGPTGAVGIEALTERELQVARLVVDRKTNPEIAAELFLSQKTIESHLRNVFNKVGVESRVALARLIERDAAGFASTSPR